ncbi:FAD-binding protein (plasmid) [Thioclava litoralis]|uniref:FAD-binding protein n=1 Tax=Thioclava litoralis TaxID=3076557 RepID=A0ABZ1E4F8_9RHOB|nr:FAD-binding protein [Thioclava sp. FTW29]
MAVLVMAEMQGQALALDATAKAVTAAQELGAVDLLVCGPDEAAQTAARLTGVAQVLQAGDAAYAQGSAENIAALLAGLATGYSHILAPATAYGRNILPRLAGLLDVMIIPDVVEILDAQTFRRPVYAGNALQTVRSQEALKVLTLRGTAFAPAPTGASAPVRAVAGPGDLGLSQPVEDRVLASERPELTSAKIVVSGGRGIGSESDFALIGALADKLGAALGASRAAVDSGFAPNDLQVGQTGKVVAPDLYIAIGISGAIQHLAGMKESKVIVAINKDEDAPIFQVADYGLVADLFQAVPELTDAL